MRIVIIGASSLAVLTTRLLLEAGHEIIIIEVAKERIEELTDTLDCGFIHGDGTRPGILREAAPKQSHALFCLTGNDQANIIASLVGRSLGFPKIVTKVSGEEFEHICIELGLERTIIPNRTIGYHLADMLVGQDALELSSMIKDDARMFSFVAREDDSGPVSTLSLPRAARVICLYRNGAFVLAELDTIIKNGDEVVVLTNAGHLATLREKWLSPGETAE